MRIALRRKRSWRDTREVTATTSSETPEIADDLTQQPADGHIPSLDGIRALAVLIVAISHVWENLPIPGRFGVTVFFFLSGFLITTLLVREHNDTGMVDLRAFWARRLIRLMPPLLIVLLATYLGQAIGAVPGSATAQGFLSQLFYFANYHLVFFDGVSEIPGGTVIFWSLAVEEHFYLFYPIVFAAAIAAKGRRLTNLLIATCVVVAFWRVGLVINGTNDFRINLSTDTRIDSIIYGALLALLWSPLKQSTTPNKPAFAKDLALACLGGVAILASFMVGGLDPEPGFSVGKVIYSSRYVLQGLALMPLFRLVIIHAQRPGLRLLESSLLRLIGRYSYTIYLSHYIFIAALRKAGLSSQPALFLGAMVYSIWLGYLIDRCVDQPLGSWRKKFRHDTRPAIAPTDV